MPLSVQAGGVLWLRGANGSGKTTLLRALAGLDGAPARDVSLLLQRSADQVVEPTVAGFVGPRHAELGLDPDAHPLDLGATDLRLAQFLAVASLERPIMLADEPDVGLDHRADMDSESLQLVRGLTCAALVFLDRDYLALAFHPGGNLTGLGARPGA